MDSTYHIQSSKYFKKYFRGNLLHRDDGPALIYNPNHCKGKLEEWYKYGKLHRINGPASINKKHIYWCKDGMFHRIDGPAKIENDSAKL